MMLCIFALPTVAQPELPVGESLQAFEQIERWVRDWDVPSVDDPAIESVEVSAAIVTLRLDGKVLGRGSSANFELSSRVIWEATKNAIQRSNSKLDGDRDAMWDAYIESIASRITITLEIAESIVPIPESELGLPGFGYTPGVLGVAVSRGNRLMVRGPESMLIQNTDMTQAAMGLANALAGDGSVVLMTPEELIGIGYSFYRFEPVVLAQPEVSMGAAFIDRGGRVVGKDEISVRSIDIMAGNIAKHLMSRKWAGVEGHGLMGTLDPVTGKSASPFASAFEQAMSAYALLKFGMHGDSQLHRESFIAGKDILRDLAAVEDGEVAPWESETGSCMAVIALSQLQLVDVLGDMQLNTLRINTIETLDGLYSLDGGFDESVPVSSHGLVVHALVAASRLDPRDRTEFAASAMNRVFEETPAPSLVAQMPFLGWAKFEMGDEGNDLVIDDSLQVMRGLVWDHQLMRNDLDWADRDLAGGIVFTSSSTPLPSWLTLRPLAIMATMLGDPQLTPGTAGAGELPVHIGRLIDSIRFVRQLCATDEVLHLYSSPSSARWGVRRALWDQRMSIEAGALALLTLVETSQSFKAVMARMTTD